MIARRMATLLNVYCGKSVMLVLILSREALKQLALSVVTGDYPCITSYLYCKQRKLWRWSTKKAIVILCVYIYQHTQLKKKYSICKKLGVKKGGRVFAGAPRFTIPNTPSPQQATCTLVLAVLVSVSQRGEGEVDSYCREPP